VNKESGSNSGSADSNESAHAAEPQKQTGAMVHGASDIVAMATIQTSCAGPDVHHLTDSYSYSYQ